MKTTQTHPPGCLHPNNWSSVLGMCVGSSSDFDEEDEDTNEMIPLGRKLFSARSVGSVGPEAILQSLI